jgi:tetratricopeptide (TPR) repeat protein
MGAVYRARRADGQFEHEVAIKIVRHGFETPAALDRFKRERQILARLTHPAIARLLDGGTTVDEAGRDVPYLVMEYVDGQPITAYTDTERLSIADRVRLFVRVCAGVQHAHHHFIVHRDLKPGNILVTRDGQPKLLDFGIAKLTDAASDDAILTQTGLGPLTPAYASPEQIHGEPVTAATDIYALGTILYELLTGQKAHQFDTSSAAEISRVICDTDVTRPSVAVARSGASPARVSRQLKGDLDTIVLMALRKEPARRYQSVEQFAGDLERHLDGLPVRARPDTFGYRSWKFVRRHAVAVSASALVALSLIGGVVTTTREARARAAEAARAERRFQQVRGLANALINDVHDEIRDLAGSTRARQKIVATGLEYLNVLERDVAGDAGLQRDLAAGYLRIGDVQGGVLASNLGDVKGALESYRKARELTAQESSAPDGPRRIAAIDIKIGDALSYHGDLPGAITSYRRARVVMEPVAARPGAGSEDLQQLAAAFMAIARVQGLQRDNTGALESAERVLLIRRSLVEAEPSNTARREALASAESEVSMALQRLSRPQEALPHARASLAIREAQVAAEPNSAAAQRSVILAYSHLADVMGNPTMASLGDAAGAVEIYRKMTAAGERLAAADPSDRRAQYDLANCQLRLGSALLAIGQYREGVTRLEASAGLMHGIAAAEPRNNRVRLTLAFVELRLGDALVSSKRSADALARYKAAIDISGHILAADPTEAATTTTLVLALGSRAEVLARIGQRAAALRDGRRGVDVAEQAQRSQPGNPRTAIGVARGYAALARTHRIVDGGDSRETCKWFVRSRDTYRDVQSRSELDSSAAAALRDVERDLAACTNQP